LVGSLILGMGVINLLWFAAALRGQLRDVGQDGWGAAALASSGALGGLSFVVLTIAASLAFSIAGTRNEALTSGLHHVAWAGFVISSFPRAMLIMSGTFGLWRAKMIPSSLFQVGVAVVVLVLLGATTWASHGVWSPHGFYSRIVSPILGLGWILEMSGVLLTRRRVAARPSERELVPPSGAVPQW
jgi:hypothetical protein